MKYDIIRARVHKIALFTKMSCSSWLIFITDSLLSTLVVCASRKDGCQQAKRIVQMHKFLLVSCGNPYRHLHRDNLIPTHAARGSHVSSVHLTATTTQTDLASAGRVGFDVVRLKRKLKCAILFRHRDLSTVI